MHCTKRRHRAEVEIVVSINDEKVAVPKALRVIDSQI